MTIAEPKKVLVTGAAGNVGSALSRTLLARNYHVVCVDNLSTGSPRKLPAGGELFRFIKADANDYGEISSILYPNRSTMCFTTRPSWASSAPWKIRWRCCGALRV